MSKQTILFVMHELELGGAERVVSNLVNNLDREKFNVHLCLFKKKGILLKGLREDIQLHDLKASRVMSSGHKLFGLILQLKPDVVFSSITHVNLLIGMFIPFLRIVNRDIRFITREVNIPSIRAKYMKKSKTMDRLYRYVIGNFDAIVAQSEYMCRDLSVSYQLDMQKIKIINNPLDTEMIIDSLEKGQDRVCFGGTNTINLLAVGNFRIQKGFDLLIRVLPYLDERFHLYIIGDGGERANIEKAIIDLGVADRVTLLGFQNNPYIYMQQADLFLLSSRYEGFPNVVLEANQCGTFVVAFQVPGVDQEIIQEGINGCLIEFKNSKAFADAIMNHAVSKDPKEIRETTQKYRVEKIVKDYERLFMFEG